MSGRHASGILLAVLLVVAAVLRLRGVTFGLPAVYNPDEVAIMSRALAFGTGDLNPHNFLYPTLYFYVLAGAVGAYFVIGTLVGHIPSLSAFQQSFFLDPTGIYLTGRLLGVAAGVAGVATTWALGRRVGGPVCGASAGLLLAVAPFAVRDAHYVKHDVPATLAITVAVLAAFRLANGAPQERSTLRLVLAAALAGVACSIHYYAVFVALPLAIAIWGAGRRAPIAATARKLAAAAAIFTAAFLAGSPFLLAEPSTAWRDIRANRQIVIDRAIEGEGGLFASAAEYAGMLWHDAIGWPAVLLACVGLAALVRRVPFDALLLLGFPVAFLVFIANTVAATRYLNPVLPFVAVLAGVAIAAVADLVGGRTRGRLAAASLAALAAIPGLLASWHTGAFFQQTDTRTLALRYMVSHVPEGSTILIQPYSVPAHQSREGLIEALRVHLGDPGRASTKFQLQLSMDEWPSPAYRTLYLGRGGLDVDKIYVDYSDLGGGRGLTELRRLGVQYVVLKRYNDEAAVIEPLVDALEGEARRMAVFSPYGGAAEDWTAADVAPFLHNTDARLDSALVRPGPVIEIWQLP